MEFDYFSNVVVTLKADLARLNWTLKVLFSSVAAAFGRAAAVPKELLQKRNEGELPVRIFILSARYM